MTINITFFLLASSPPPQFFPLYVSSTQLLKLFILVTSQPDDLAWSLSYAGFDKADPFLHYIKFQMQSHITPFRFRPKKHNICETLSLCIVEWIIGAFFFFVSCISPYIVTPKIILTVLSYWRYTVMLTTNGSVASSVGRFGIMLETTAIKM